MSSCIKRYGWLAAGLRVSRRACGGRGMRVWAQWVAVLGVVSFFRLIRVRSLTFVYDRVDFSTLVMDGGE